MKLVVAFMLMTVSSGAIAQIAEEAVLFPELSDFGTSQPLKAEEEVVVAGEQEELLMPDLENNAENAQAAEEDLFTDPMVVPEVPKEASVGVDKEEETEGEEDQNQHIYLVLDDVKATLTPNRNASFCSAVLAVANGLKKQIKVLAGNFTVGSMKKEFRFNNVEKGQAMATQYMFVGTSCEKILDLPEYAIDTCEVEGWSEKKCKNRVQFVPIPKEENTLE